MAETSALAAGKASHISSTASARRNALEPASRSFCFCLQSRSLDRIRRRNGKHWELASSYSEQLPHLRTKGSSEGRSQARVLSCRAGPPRAKNSIANQEHPRQGEIYQETAWLVPPYDTDDSPPLPVFPMLSATGISLSVCLYEFLRQHYWLPIGAPSLLLPNDAHIFVGTPLGFLLALRLNNAYERWIQGRNCFDQITTSIRISAATLTLPLVETEREELSQLLNTLKAFALAARDYIRRDNVDSGADSAPRMARNIGAREGVMDDASSLLDPSEKEIVEAARSPPIAIINGLRLRIRDLVAEGKIAGSDEGRVNEQLNVLVTAVTSCERLLTTRMPSAFIMQLRTLLLLWLCTLPFVLVRALGPEIAIFAHFAVTWGLLGIEAAAQTCEQPFGYEYNDLPLNRLCDELCRDIDSSAKSAQMRANARLKEVGNS